MRAHILGIGGTFMAGVAVLAKQYGMTVSGSDANIYPPMSTQLAKQDIPCYEGYAAQHLQPAPDRVVVGNAMRRGNPAVEYMLAENIPYTSGPQWLAETILRERTVLAVAGTHGKTTTSSMLAWILEYAGLQPGFLIGGIPQNFGVSARLGEGKFFVIEADEYDTAFFDKRSKFIHYRPQVLIINNIEFDHADIFPDLTAIKKQFHHVIRTVPGNGLIIYPQQDKNICDTIAQGCWTPCQTIGLQQGDWQAVDIAADGSAFTVNYQSSCYGRVAWQLLGLHNVYNALAAVGAAHFVGVSIEQAIAALAEFKSVKKRLEVKGKVNGITVYDDFAHHPTAIAATLQGLRQHVGQARIIAVLEFSSYTLREGVLQAQLVEAFSAADSIYWARPNPDWSIDAIAAQLSQPACVCDHVDDIVSAIKQQARSGDHIVVMGKTAFGDIHQKLLTALA